MFMVSAAPLKLVDESSHHCNNALKKSCAFVTAIGFALHLKMKGIVLVEEKRMVS